MSISRIELPESDFHQLAIGGGSPDVVKRLWDSEHSRRLVMLRAFLEADGDDISEAWSVLETAERVAPGAVRELIMHPQIGSWLAYGLRRHRGGATSSAPSRHEFAHLNTVAIAAAALAGQTFRTSVPLRAGQVMVPLFGMARFDACADWDSAEAGTEDGRIWLRHGDQLVTVPADGSDAPGWWALRRLTVGDSLRLTVWLDDLDPWRDLADPVRPARLSADAFARWADLLDGAWRILLEGHRELAEGLAAGVTSLVPLPVGDGWDTRSASTGDAFGAIMCSPPPDPKTLAVSLAHEFTHIKLGGLMHLFTMTDGVGRPSLYAPWRDDPRPAGGLLQGIYAFFAITDFWRRQRLVQRDVLDDFEYAYSKAMTEEALTIALRDGDLSDRGRRFAEALGEAMREWPDDDVDGPAARLALIVADGHRAGWRIRHCHPRAEDVDALVAAWNGDTGERVALKPSDVQPDPEMKHWSAGRLGLARRRLRSPEHYAEARHADWGATLSDADLLLFAGEPAKAAAAFAEEIAADPDSFDAWTGLGLALREDSPAHSPAGTALTTRPEVVLAVHRRSPAARSPIDLATWIGGQLGAPAR
ncbi:HEXXH motif domain-containing protein [Actinoplanes sp. NPDC049265]|uniref:HEXXH motif domain-containing protein n=1 Tax=Actinoplanes sp. NPDC049265 TaxID=3363902 RepID=UPI003722B1E4